MNGICEKEYRRLTEDELNNEYTKLKKVGVLNSKNCIESHDRHNKITHVDRFNTKRILFLTDEELDARKKMKVVLKLLGKSPKPEPREVARIEPKKSVYNEFNLLSYYIAKNSRFYFLVDLAFRLGISSGRERIKQNADSTYRVRFASGVGLNSAYIKSLQSSTHFRNDLRLLELYCDKVRKGVCPPQTFRWFCIFWMESTVQKRINESEQEQLYGLVRERMGKSPIVHD